MGCWGKGGGGGLLGSESPASAHLLPGYCPLGHTVVPREIWNNNYEIMNYGGGGGGGGGGGNKVYHQIRDLLFHQ